MALAYRHNYSIHSTEKSIPTPSNSRSVIRTLFPSNDLLGTKDGNCNVSILQVCCVNINLEKYLNYLDFMRCLFRKLENEQIEY